MTHRITMLGPGPNNGWHPISAFPADLFDYPVEVGWWRDERWVSFIASKARNGWWSTAGRSIAVPDWWRERTSPPPRSTVLEYR